MDEVNNPYILKIQSISTPNKYFVWWRDIIEFALLRASTRIEATELLGYVEGHHITPISFDLGGESDPTNITYLTPKEHLIVHHLMCKFLSGKYKAKSWYAFRCMAGIISVKGIVSPRLVAIGKMKNVLPPAWSGVDSMNDFEVLLRSQVTEGNTDDVIAEKFSTSITSVRTWRKIFGIPIVKRPGVQASGSTHPSTIRAVRWRAANRDRHNGYHRAYRNPTIEQMLDDPDEIWFVRDARKRALLKQATPSGVDRGAIRSVYEKCAVLNRRYPGTGFVVHHTVPITHPKVCGLHVPANLEIVSLSRKKQLGRKFDLRPSRSL